MKIIEAGVTATEAKIAIAITRFNSFINKNLLDGAIDTLKRIGQVQDDNITVIRIPGAYELPLVIQTIISNHNFSAIVALGTIIRGATPHFEYIAAEASAGISRTSLNSGIPVAFGILTTEDSSQAIERSGIKAGNKGSEAALTALEMINILKSVKSEI
jgi:6,7-dimethyl-8-ribityllumazine synthase